MSLCLAYVMSHCTDGDMEGLFYNQKTMIPGNYAETFLKDMFPVRTTYSCMYYIYSMFNTTFFYEIYKPNEIKYYNEASSKKKYYYAGLLSDHDPNHKHSPYRGSSGTLASVSLCILGTFP